MSKVENFAIKKYPVSIEDIYGHKIDVNLWQRKAYVEGYHQAEKDLELSREDIKTIDKLLNQCVDCSNPYQEVLKRFKEREEK